MYADLDIVAVAEASARGVATADRMKYIAFLREIEQFAAKNSMIVGGKNASRLLLKDNEARPDSFHYELFSDRALDHAKRLAGALYEIDPDGLGHYTVMTTKVPGEEFTIVVDGREFVKIKALATHRGARIAEIVLPAAVPAIFAKSGSLRLLSMGAEIQLMEIYSTLCSPASASEWGDLLKDELGLRKVLTKEIRGKIESAVAGGASQSELRRKAHNAILHEYGARAGRVMVGRAALPHVLERARGGAGNAASIEAAFQSERGHGSDRPVERLQFIAANDLSEEQRALRELAAAHGLPLQMAINEPKIPTEPRIRRLTVYLVADKREAVLDVFNVASYELVPYNEVVTKDGARLKVGTLFVLMRFRLIDLWTIQLLLSMKAVIPQFAKSIMLECIEDYERCATEYERALEQGAGALATLLPLRAMIGRLEDPEIARKRLTFAMSKKSGVFHPPFYPAKNAARGPKPGPAGPKAASRRPSKRAEGARAPARV